MQLETLSLFLRIVEKGGLAAAGRELGLSPSSVSERLAALERHYGAALLVRTTRAVTLTEEGRVLADGARRLLAEADDLAARIRLGADRLSGPVRLSAPMDFGRRHLVPLLDAFGQDHPEVTFDLHLSDSHVDLVAAGMDLAVRHGLLADSSLKVRPLGTARRVVCAAPSYLARHGVPQHPQDLAGHRCLLMRFGTVTEAVWPFRIGGRMERVPVPGHRIANDGDLIRRWCLDGQGIAYKSLFDVAGSLRDGSLTELLPLFSSGATALQLVYPATAAQPRRVRALVEFLTGRLTRHLAEDANTQSPPLPDHA
ncbi:LysR family transcriptional regulator [Novispirillum itersonii]|uniref:DNA-binding transcriptional LysR family regulator n=1 Tax=Novispirillum itersonii TaxID=189 RepID=A0A7W9ZFE0_NOVIT|nr:LysR family transcriptional regulator [Novispirillum itersonii]MBB6210486.1 DNA-binding transcriptional LysR family regulator [Novispirillum itersonii]